MLPPAGMKIKATPCPRPSFEIVGGKRSGVCIEEISVWPLEPLSAPPLPRFAGAPWLFQHLTSRPEATRKRCPYGF